MSSFFSLSFWIVIAGVSWMLKRCWDEAFEDAPPSAGAGFAAWIIKGLLGPILVWIVIGGGLLPGSTPLIPELAGLRGKTGFQGAVLQATGPVAFLGATLWVAVSAGWLTALAGQRVRDPSEYRVALVFWTLVLALPAWAVWKLGGVYGTGTALSIWLLPLCWFTNNMEVKRILPPSYSKAIARSKLGHYAEAEQAVLEELEHHTNDSEGWLMLAELYASKFNDLPEADRTVRQLCREPGINAVQISLALNRLADWHLKYNQDPVAARAALTEIIRLLPESHAARMAGQRLAQMARSREEYLEQQRPKPVALPALSDPVAPAPTDAASALTPSAARERAERCVERLREDPNRVETREQFARLLAGPLRQVPTAIDQLELLLAIPDQPDPQRAEWLALIAAWQEQLLADRPASHRTLQRLIRDFPQTPQAFAAQRKLSLREVDERIQARKNRQPPPSPRLRVE